MLRVKNVSMSFGERNILNNLSFIVASGEKVGLVGDNGAGKTTLLRIIAGELEPEQGEVAFPRRSKTSMCYIPQHLSLRTLPQKVDVLTFMLAGRDLHTLSRRLNEIDTLLQGPLGDVRLAALLDERVQLEQEYLAKEGYRAEDDILSILVGVGLGAVDLDQPLVTLSGGQKSRLALARLLFVQADVLLLDEPTNHIDEEAVAWLGSYLAAVQQTVLVISHLPGFLDRVAKKIIFLDDQTGLIKSYPGNYTQFLTLRGKEHTTRAKTTKKLQAELSRQQAFIRTIAQSKSRQKHSREKVVRRLEQQLPVATSKKEVRLHFPVKKTLHNTALMARGICKRFDAKQVLNQISFEVAPTTRLGITGENGAGKTTLLHILTGELAPDTGAITRSRQLEIGWYRQEMEDLTESHTIWEEVSSLGFGSIQELRGALAHFLFGANRLHQLVGTLSRGERARLALCKLILSRPNLLLLDEPTNHLDQPSRAKLISALSSYEGALVVVSHDGDFLAGVGIEWALQLPGGSIARIGT